ncbi:hypothetical protein BJV77DRAFT_1156551 [Russula vinacea]|nr:hypothetical protein BJV77DRAFT_1156551 [Russula vinacea]
MIPCPYDYMPDNLYPHLYQAPVSIERLQAMSRWFTHLSPDVSDAARTRVAKNLPRMQERDNRWIGLASDACGLASDDIQHNIAMGGDNMLLATLIDVSRQAIRSNILEMLELVEALTQFDIRRTHLRLQHDFCMLWNELVQEARNREPYVILTDIAHIDVLRLIRLLYVALHQGTRAAPTAFSPSTDLSDPILFEPSSYPLCDISSHRQVWIAHPHVPVPNSRAVSLLTQSTDSPDALPRHSTSRGDTVSQQVKQANVIAGPPAPSDPTISSEIGDSSQVPKATSLASLVHTSSRPTDTSPPRAQDIPPAATLSRALQNIVVPCAERDTREILSTASTPAHTPTPSPVPEFIPPVLNESSTSCDAGAASASNSLLPASSVVGFSVPASPPPSRVSPFPNAESLALFDGTTPFPLTRNAALLHPRARGLVNIGSMCFVSAVLQLLVRSPPLWNLFRRWGDLKGQSGTGGPETGGGATSLMDATVIFFDEFMNKEKGPFPTQQISGGKLRECEEAKKEPNDVDSFEPTYIYNAMKEKRQLKICWMANSRMRKSFSASTLTRLTKSCSRYKNPVESPLMRIFGGKFRTPQTSPTLSTVKIGDHSTRHPGLYSHSATRPGGHLRPVRLDPSGFSEARLQVKIEVLPPILVLQLKRFLYDVAADGIVKINKYVQFAPELEIPLEIMAPDAEKPAEPVHYKLYGVLYHHGESADSWHYSVDVLHQNGCSDSGEAWLHIDDEVVRALRHEDDVW